MNTALPIVLLNTLARRQAAAPSSSKLQATKTKKRTHIFSSVAGASPCVTEPETTDSKQNNFKGKFIAGKRQQLSIEFHERANVAVGHMIPNTILPRQSKTSARNTNFQPEILRQWLVEHKQKVGYKQNPIDTDKMPLNSKAEVENAQISLVPKTETIDTFSPAVSPVVSPVASPVASADKVVKNTVIPAPDSANTLAAETASSSDSELPLVAEKPSAEAKNRIKSPISEKTATAVKHPSNNTAVKETVSQTPHTTEKTATAALINHNTTKETVSQTTPNAEKTASDTAAPVIADKPLASDGQKMPTTANLTDINSKSSKPQSQPEDIASVKSAPLVEKQTDNKADTNLQIGSNPPTLAETSHNNKNNTGKFVDAPLQNNLSSEQMVSTNKTKDSNAPFTNNNSGNNSDKTIKQTISLNDDTAPSFAEEFLSPPSAAKVANNVSQTELSSNLPKQLQESITGSLKAGQQQITIRLNPAELGKVSIKFQEQDQQIIGLLEVSKAQTRVEIQQALPEIIQNLQNSGIHIKRLEVVMDNQQEQQQFSKDQSLAGGHNTNSQTGQQNSTNPNMRQDYPAWTGNDAWLTNADGFTDFNEPLGQITNNAINILV